MTLDDLGCRLCIIGPSNSGKSTLADAIGRSLGLPPIHLDQLRHLPGTDWQPRPNREFMALHDDIIATHSWVIEGNYSMCLPQRLDRATGVILLDVPTATSLFRYLRRSWFESDRKGALNNGTDRVKWDMIRHITTTTRQNRARNKAKFNRMSLPKLALRTSREIKAFYHAERLER